MKIFVTFFVLSVVALSSCKETINNPVNSTDSMQVPKDGLVAYYSFNGNAQDSSGNNFHGDVSGAVLTTDRFGNPNKAYEFDGDNDYIVVNNVSNTRLEPTNAITLSCFINANSTHGNSSWSRLIRKVGAFDNGYCLSWDNEDNSTLQVFLLANCIPAQYYTPSDKANLSNISLVGEWHHVAVTYSESSRTMKLYIDGALATTTTNCSYDFQHSADELFIGGTKGEYGIGSGNYETFPGKIDDVRIYERALSKSEIHALYHEGGFGM